MVINPKPTVERARRESRRIMQRLETIIDEALKKGLGEQITPHPKITVSLQYRDHEAYYRLRKFNLWGELLEKYKKVGWTVIESDYQKSAFLDFSYQQP